MEAELPNKYRCHLPQPSLSRPFDPTSQEDNDEDEKKRGQKIRQGMPHRARPREVQPNDIELGRA
jgi:hypothetical protein